MAQRPKSGGGCLSIFLVLVLIGLAIQYWYVALPLTLVLIVVGLVAGSRKRKAQLEAARRQEELARHRPGPRDPWLNEIAVALSDFEFTEYARNTGTQVAGVPIEGDIQLLAPHFAVIVTLVASPELAHQAEIGLRANPEVRTAIRDGYSIVRAVDRVLYVANGRGGVADEAQLNEVAQIVGTIPVGPPRLPGTSGAPPTRLVPSSRSQPTAAAPVASADVLDQLKRLGELRQAGVLTDAEFEAKKAELLRRF
jgi:hypothetical protein